MKIVSANLMDTSTGELLSVRWMGTDAEIATWKSKGLVPLDAQEVIAITEVTDAEMARIAFEMLPVAGRVLQ